MTADLEKRIQAFENKCYRTMLGVSHREHQTNEYIWQRTGQCPRRTSGVLALNRQVYKLSWYGHVCQHDTLPITLLAYYTEQCYTEQLNRISGGWLSQMKTAKIMER